MKHIIVIDLEGEPVIVPLDNISHISMYETTTRIYLRHVAGNNGVLWYVQTKTSVQSVAELIDDEASE